MSRSAKEESSSAQRLEVTELEAQERLDKFLAKACKVARNRAQGWIRAGAVSVNGIDQSSSRKLAAGDVVVIDQAILEEASLRPLLGEPWPDAIKVLGETDDYVILDKPANLVVHPGAGRDSGTLANFLVERWPEMAHLGHEQRPGIVHRLDVGTTGVMMVARSERGFQSLSSGFAERRIQKIYLAVVYGRVKAPLDIDLPIGRHPTERKKMTVRKKGRPARSTVTPIATAASDAVSLVAVQLHTGRTHQIRVHLKAAKHPLVGDPTYGEARWKALANQHHRPLSKFPRPALHAWRLRFEDPSSNEPCFYEAPLAQDIIELWLHLSADSQSPERSLADLLRTFSLAE